MGKEALNYNSTQYLNEADFGYLPEKKELLGKSIILGDQSPWAGGLVRMEALEADLGSTTYFIQDADTPWKTDGYSMVSIRNGWSDYWSLAARFPFSFSTPNTRIDNVRQSLGSPDGLAYLIGPKTSTTIRSELDNPKVGRLVNEMLREEAGWATKIAEWMSVSDAVDRGKQIQTLFEEDKSLKDALSRVMSLSISPSNNPSSLTDSFRESPVKLLGSIPISNYWVIDKDGRRRELDNKTVLNNGEILLPKGKALPLEISARGDVLGFTGLSYLDGVIGMRDKFVPGLKLKFVEINFNWQLNPNPIEAMWEAFKVKKQLRGQYPQKPINDFERINAYWMNRPTTITYKILGGNLNPEIRYREL